MDSTGDSVTNGSPNPYHTSPAQSSQKSPFDATSSEPGRTKATSCDFCRRLKIKCERPAPDAQCSQCASRHAVCVRSVVPRRPKPKKKVNIEAMESRIRQMESVIATAVSKSEDPDRHNFPVEKLFETQVEKPDTRSFVFNGETSFQFVGPSSGFSIFSPCGFRWIEKKTGNTHLERVVSQVARLDLATWDQGSWGRSVNITWHPLLPEQRHELPDRILALVYVEAYFRSVNSMFPLFDKDIFYRRFERQYSEEPPDDLSWYACLNVVLALGSSIVRTGYPATNPLRSPESVQILPEELPGKYLRNATSLIAEIQFGSPCLMSVQAVIGMAIMLQGSPNPLSTETLVAIAVRISHAIGLNSWLDDCGLSEQQLDERRNVFWMLYVLDKGVSLHRGRPSFIHDQDIGVALPKPTPFVCTTPSSFPNGSTFVMAVKLAMLESRVYSELYCARARAKPIREKLKAVGMLDHELQRWRQELPSPIRPGNPIVCDEQYFLPILVLHYSYYNCLTTIHRASMHYGPWTDLPEEREPVNRDIGLNPRVYDSESICVAAAREVIHLLDHFKQSPAPPMFWISLSLPLCASLTLFANILQYPEDPCAIPDLDLISSVTSLMGQLVAQGRLQFATGTLWIFQELFQIANLYLSVPEARVGENHGVYSDTSVSSLPVSLDLAAPTANFSDSSPINTDLDLNTSITIANTSSAWYFDINSFILPDGFSFQPMNTL